MSLHALTVRLGEGDTERLRVLARQQGKQASVVAQKLLSKALRGGDANADHNGNGNVHQEVSHVVAGDASAETRNDHWPPPPPEPPLAPWHIRGPLLKEFMAEKHRHPWSEDEWNNWMSWRQRLSSATPL